MYLFDKPFYIFVSFMSALLFFSGCQQPEPEEPDPVHRKSPIAIANTLHEPSDTYIKIVYGQPYKRDRQIFGNVVPFNEVWRTGANEATELTTTKEILFAGEPLEAGTYALFSIPQENDQWTIILNSALGQWGAFEYNKEKDVLRVDVPASKLQKVSEAFTIRFSETVDDSTDIILRWDQTEVRIPIEFTADN